MSSQEEEVPALLGWVQLVLREGAAFSLPAFLGWWFLPSLGWMALAIAAHLSGREALARLRGLVAVVAGLLCGHVALAVVQLMVAGAWLLPRARRGLTLAAMLVVVLGARAEDVLPLAAPEPGELTLVSCNLEMPLHARWVDDLTARFQGHPIDLLVLMETSYNHSGKGRPKILQGRGAYLAGAARMGEEHGLVHAWLDDREEGRSGVFSSGTAVLSRYPLRVVAGSEDRGAEGPPPMLEVDAPGGPLMLSPLHMRLPTRVSTEARRRELATIMRRVPPARPHVLAGDLNSLPLERHPVAPAENYQDAAHASAYYGGTWPSPLPLGRIDAVYLSAALEARATRVLPDWGSDHRALWVRFRRRPSGT